MPRTFPTKVDTWLAVVLGGAALVTVGGAVVSLVEGHYEGVGGVVVMALAFGVFLFPMHYTVADDALVIRYGLVRSRVQYRDIRAVKPTWNPISSPAMSLDRLHIDCGNPLGPNISPRDREGFYAALLEKAPHLRREGDRLVSGG
ncbi:MAG: PH domain-containing protein [Deltaproteobacteria bacterium]|nr:PH domain-containing protein [Deltaproteobacteria bacterium]